VNIVNQCDNSASNLRRVRVGYVKLVLLVIVYDLTI